MVCVSFHTHFGREVYFENENGIQYGTWSRFSHKGNDFCPMHAMCAHTLVTKADVLMFSQDAFMGRIPQLELMGFNEDRLF